MEIRRKGSLALLCTRKFVTVFVVGMFIFLSSMLFINKVNAEVFKATAYCSCEKCCDKDLLMNYMGLRRQVKGHDGELLQLTEEL